MIASDSGRLVDRAMDGLGALHDALQDALHEEALAILLALAAGVLALGTTGHVLLYKRRPRAAFGWIAVCLTFPLAGPTLYLLFGVNRVKRRAQKLRGEDASRHSFDAGEGGASGTWMSLVSMGERITGRPLIQGNHVEPLQGGDQAYPRMRAAIEQARQRVFLSSYLFDTDQTGQAFAEALGRAVQRGVDVRVLLDGVGELYSFPRARSMLRRHGVSVQRFLPPRLLPPSFMLNLRNHRKLLLVDDEVAFLGGMNISDRHLAHPVRRRQRVIDLHFEVRGRVLAELHALFESDWLFAGGRGESSVPVPRPAGSSPCRVLADGPDETLDRLLLSMVGAVGLARKRVAIMTPYLIPPRELLGSLTTAALRGVDVSILLPARNNLFFVHRATRHLLWELLERGVRVYYQPGNFVHSKLFLVDESYAQIGSANLDPRSLRLNFELNLEVHDPDFVQSLGEHYARARSQAREISLADVDGRSIPTRLLDGLAWLFSPYL